MNKEQILKRLAMNIVNQLFDLADVPVEKRQAVNDEADEGVMRLLQQTPCYVGEAAPLVCDNCTDVEGYYLGTVCPKCSILKCQANQWHYVSGMCLVKQLI